MKTSPTTRAKTPNVLQSISRAQTPTSGKVELPVNTVRAKTPNKFLSQTKTLSTLTYDTPHDTPHVTARPISKLASRAQSRVSRPATTTPAPRISSPPKKSIRCLIPSEPQIVHIHVGNAGTALGLGMWEFVCKEWGVQQDGVCKYDHTKKEKKNRIGTYFHELQNGQYIPRCLFIDSEIDSQDMLYNHEYRPLFSNDPFIISKQSSDGCFWRGYEDCWFNLDYNEMMRKQIEQCDNLQGIVYTTGLAGGAAGILSRIVETAKEVFSPKVQACIPIFPSLSKSSAPHILNTLLSLQHINTSIDAMLPFCNSALSSLCKTIGIDTSMKNRNTLAVYALCALTSGFRYGASSISSLSDISANLIPYQNCKLISTAFSPFYHSTNEEPKHAIQDLLLETIKDSSQLTCSVSANILASCIQIRGEFAAPELYQFNQDMKKGKFYDVLQHSAKFKYSVAAQTVPTLTSSFIGHSNRDAVLLHNSNNVTELLKRVHTKASVFVTKKTCIHKYLQEGVHESQFQNSLEYLLDVVEAYKNVSS